MTVLAALSWLAVAAGPEVAPRDVTDELVRGAASAIVEAIYGLRHEERFWDPPSWDPDRDGQSSQAGGYTPLVVLALLYAGESYQDPRLLPAVEHLAEVELTGTYAVAVRAHVWALLPDKFGSNLEADVKWLLEAFQPRHGGWSYRQRPTAHWYDNSLAQYGTLALWEAAKRDAAVPVGLWQRLEQRFLDTQFADGGWNYRGTQPVTGSMTAAGLTALFITQDFLHAREALSLEDRPAPTHEQAIERGLAWMNANFDPDRNPGKDTYFYYYLYGVERVGLASGRTLFGGRDWFREGAAAVINRLCEIDPDTGQVAVRPRGSQAASSDVRRLAFALMFLSRGRVPVAVNKLMVDAMSWNNRPRDVANLVRWLREQTETDLSWQIVSLADEPVRWLDAPLLYLASDEPLPWIGPADRRRKTDATPPPLARLKRYLDLGGTLLAVNEGRASAFARSVEEAGKLLYPQYRWRTLPPEHWAHGLHFSGRGRRPALRGLSNGVRELIVLCPSGDLPATFQVADPDPPAAWSTAGNLYLYASEKNRQRPRLAAHGPVETRQSALRDGALTIARASYDGNWRPEPEALPAFAAAMAEQRRLDVRIVEAPLADVPGLTPRPDLVVVSGIEAHRFTEPQRRAVEALVESGGTILFETAGGTGDFATSAEQVFGDLFGLVPAPVLASPIVTGDGLPGGRSAARVAYRPFARETFGVVETTPRLRALVIDGAPRVLFSREDLSHSLLDQPCWGVAGYATQSARDLLGNLLELGNRQNIRE